MCGDGDAKLAVLEKPVELEECVLLEELDDLLQKSLTMAVLQELVEQRF